MSDLIRRDDATKAFDTYFKGIQARRKHTTKGETAIYIDLKGVVESLPTIEERKEGRWIRTGRTNVYGGEELMCPFCGDRVIVQNIEYELYCRQCGALLGDRAKGEDDEVD